MRIFGLDLGTTSIGFAVVELSDDKNEGKIQRLGVRIFPEARDPDGTPLNQTRRAKRMMRRQLRRRRERRRSFNELLVSLGFLPAFASLDWASVMSLDPYALRDRGVCAELQPFELGRALYHLSKHRHFRERDLGDEETKSDEAAKEKEEQGERESFVASLKSSGLTLGQSLARRESGVRKRGVHATRAVVTDEFNKLLAVQQPYHAALKDRAIRGAIEEAIFAQRPVFWRKKTLGSCRFIPGAPLCPKGSWLSQERRMLEKVNNLAIVGGNARPLDHEERAAIIRALSTQKSMSWPGVRKTLEPIFKARGESAKGLKFNLEYGDEKGGLKGNLVEASLSKIIGAGWDSYAQKAELRDFLPSALWEADYGDVGDQRVVIRLESERASRRKVLSQRLIADFGLSNEQAEEFIKLDFPQGWEPFSTKALEIFLPQLEQGARFGTLTSSPDYEAWRDRNFPERDRPTGEVFDKLPSPKDRDEARRIAQLRNPTVVRVQNELRKVVNNLISLYGKPDLIRIELAREVGKSKREREEMSAAMRQQERRRSEARNELIQNGRTDPSRDDIEKWLLWQESQRQCPYTGDMIGFNDLWTGQYEVEHIWPRSISLDNSFANKTLCRKDINAAKGNRLPFDYFKADKEKWEEVKARVGKMVGRNGMSPGKAKRFAAEEIADAFKNRQLTDTGYAAREARSSLQRLWPDIGPEAPVKVQIVTGRITAQLRKGWGLNNVLSDDGEKTRADHRHHAIDALVVACTDGGRIQKLAEWLQERDEGRKPTLAVPWAAIREDATRATEKIVVSHRVRKKVSGPLHKETIYGDTGLDEKTRSGTYRFFVTRKPVERLSKTEIETIVDPHIRDVVRRWVAEHGGDPKKAFTTFPKVSEKGPEIRKVRLRTKQQLTLMAPVSTGYADLGSNHHVEIYKTVDNKVSSVVVSLFEAIGRLGRKEPVVNRNCENGGRFIMSLAQGDTLHFADSKMKGFWIVQSIWSGGQIVLLRANDADGQSVVRPTTGSIIRDGGRKVSVDPVGRVRPAND
ncbi:CRISPR-associated endonuclease Cas9 [freshwater sediment metagenome]|uniref:CRISPR-associated endonuclease Cas9 n=1 Tax=freshwater sediment metagenome TaxID=556182 RepID=A0AA48M2C8_9ZZZZ